MHMDRQTNRLNCNIHAPPLGTEKRGANVKNSSLYIFSLRIATITLEAEKIRHTINKIRLDSVSFGHTLPG